MPVSGFENCRVKVLLGMIALVALVAACGSESTTDTSNSAIAPIEVAELLDDSTPMDASVIGFVDIDDGGARLCEALAESFPPKCGGPAVVIANPTS
jgi:5S rRNA maturation endonuclease (ribonuclease M5)